MEVVIAVRLTLGVVYPWSIKNHLFNEITIRITFAADFESVVQVNLSLSHLIHKCEQFGFHFVDQFCKCGRQIQAGVVDFHY